jgi:hypothetical protein
VRCLINARIVIQKPGASQSAAFSCALLIVALWDLEFSAGVNHGALCRSLFCQLNPHMLHSFLAKELFFEKAIFALSSPKLRYSLLVSACTACAAVRTAFNIRE